jgi:hypothetical protein
MQYRISVGGVKIRKRMAAARYLPKFRHETSFMGFADWTNVRSHFNFPARCSGVDACQGIRAGVVAAENHESTPTIMPVPTFGDR